jgi:stage V sporulation protein R
MTTPLITSRTDWTEALIHEIYGHIEDVAINDLELDVYDNQIEIIPAERMIDAYASVGMPVNYSHWSFGKEFLKNWTKYQKGRMGLAYEIVINSDPCISYLMEENNAVTQALVIAHAAFGHNYVFKNNFMFKEWTTAGSILDYMIFAKNYIRECEEKYGEEEVERVLDAAHSLTSHAVDKRKRKHKKKKTEEDKMKEEAKKADDIQANLDIIIQSTSIQEAKKKEDEADLDKVDDEENLVYFIYKHAPNLAPWKREILRIVYKIQQYFYPQGQDKVLNEGMATFCHFYIMDQMEQKGLISPDAQMAWLHLHSNVVYQPDMHSKHYDGKFNPYALGYDILKEVRRVCEYPTKEDQEWFPELAGGDWRTEIKKAVTDYRDESFIEQFMTPNLMRKYKMMTVDYTGKEGRVTEISDDIGYRNMRRTLASQYNLINFVPDLVVTGARMRGDRTLTLEYKPYRGRALHRVNAEKTLAYVKYLWGYEVEIVEDAGDDVQRVLYKT